MGGVLVFIVSDLPHHIIYIYTACYCLAQIHAIIKSFHILFFSVVLVWLILKCVNYCLLYSLLSYTALLSLFYACKCLAFMCTNLGFGISVIKGASNLSFKRQVFNLATA